MPTAQIQLGNKVASRSYLTNGLTNGLTNSLTSGRTADNPTRVKPRPNGLRSSLEQPSTNRATGPARFQGRWAGLLTQPGLTWNFEMSLRRAGATRIVGTSVITSLSDPSVFGVMSLRGRVVNGALLFKETVITDQNPPPGSRWCIKGGRLKLSTANGRTFLRGPWSDPTCNAGQIRLQKR
jgi:hypothetical protein